MGRGIQYPVKIQQKGFCPKKEFCPSWKIYRRGSVYLVKLSGRDYIHDAKNIEGIMPTYTKMSRRGYVREGFCPTLHTSVFWYPVNQARPVTRRIGSASLTIPTLFLVPPAKIDIKRH